MYNGKKTFYYICAITLGHVQTDSVRERKENYDFQSMINKEKAQKTQLDCKVYYEIKYE